MCRVAVATGASVQVHDFLCPHLEAAAGRQEQQEEVFVLRQDQAWLPPQQEDGLLSRPRRWDPPGPPTTGPAADARYYGNLDLFCSGWFLQAETSGCLFDLRCLLGWIGLEAKDPGLGPPRETGTSADARLPPCDPLTLGSATLGNTLAFFSLRKRPLSPPPKSSGKGPAAPSGRAAVPGSGSNKPGNTLSRREELLKQLKAVEDAIARKRAKIPAK